MPINLSRTLSLTINLEEVEYEEVIDSIRRYHTFRSHRHHARVREGLRYACAGGKTLDGNQRPTDGNCQKQAFADRKNREAYQRLGA